MRIRPWRPSRPASMRRLSLEAAALVLLIMGVSTVVGVSPAAATTLTVTNCANSGAGSLRQTVADATSGDIIRFDLSPPCSTITNPTGYIIISKDLNIEGPGSTSLSISGEGSNGLLEIFSGITASISGLTIEDGVNGAVTNAGNLTITSSALPNNNGAIFNTTGSLTMHNDTVSGSSSTAIVNGGTLDIFDGTFANNTGGAVQNNGTMTMTESTLSGNTAGNGGAIYNTGMATVSDSTFEGNTSTVSGTGAGSPGGGAIFNSGTLAVSNSTLTGNTSAKYGGAIFNNTGTTTVTSSTLTGNTAQFVGGGIDGSARIQTSLFANNSPTDCFDSTTDGGYNVDDDGSCRLSPPSISDYTTLSRTIGLLADNGGPTQTIALLPGNPGIDYVPAADCPPTDQRGFARTAPCDIGAYDTDGVACPALSITTASLPTAAPGAFYSAPLAAVCGNPPYKWKLARGSAKLPKGLKLNKHTGVISGTPKRTAKSSTFTVEVLDKKIKVKHHHATRNSATKVFSITIS